MHLEITHYLIQKGQRRLNRQCQLLRTTREKNDGRDSRSDGA